MILLSSRNSRIRMPLRSFLTLRPSLRQHLVGLLGSADSDKARLNKPYKLLGLRELLAVLQEASLVKQEIQLPQLSSEAVNQTRARFPLPAFPYLSRRPHLSGNNQVEPHFLGIHLQTSLASDSIKNQQRLKHKHLK